MERCSVAHQECCYLHRLTRLLSPTTSSKSAFLYLPVGFRPSPGLLDQGGAHPEHAAGERPIAFWPRAQGGLYHSTTKHCSTKDGSSSSVITRSGGRVVVGISFQNLCLRSPSLTFRKRGSRLFRIFFSFRLPIPCGTSCSWFKSEMGTRSVFLLRNLNAFQSLCHLHHNLS